MINAKAHRYVGVGVFASWFKQPHLAESNLILVLGGYAHLFHC